MKAVDVGIRQINPMQVLDEDWLVLLFYQYCNLKDPLSTCKEQLQMCEQLNLTGRIRISPEGINGCLGGHSKYIKVNHREK